MCYVLNWCIYAMTAHRLTFWLSRGRQGYLWHGLSQHEFVLHVKRSLATKPPVRASGNVEVENLLTKQEKMTHKTSKSRKKIFWQGTLLCQTASVEWLCAKYQVLLYPFGLCRCWWNARRWASGIGSKITKIVNRTNLRHPYSILSCARSPGVKYEVWIWVKWPNNSGGFL